MRFEHYIHPCLICNTSTIAISRLLLPFGLQGYELTVCFISDKFIACSVTLIIFFCVFSFHALYYTRYVLQGRTT